MLNLGSWGEILIIVIAALILLGPEELPQVLRACGRWVYRLRRLSTQFHDHVDQWLQEGQLEEFERMARQDAEKQSSLGSSASLDRSESSALSEPLERVESLERVEPLESSPQSFSALTPSSSDEHHETVFHHK